MNKSWIKIFSNQELSKTSKIDNLDSVAIEKIRKSLEIKSIRIHLNDGSCQGLFNKILLNKTKLHI